MSQKGQQHQFVATTATPLDGPVEGVRPDDGVAPKADRGRSTPRRRPLGERHPEQRAFRPVRLKLSSRQVDDPLLRLQFAIIIAPGNLQPCRGKIMCRCSGCCFPTGGGWSVSGARPHIAKEDVDDESWCGLSADRTWRRSRGGQGVCPGGGGPGLRPYCDLRSCPRRRACRQRTEIDRSL